MIIRFYLDEHISPAIANGLRLRGVDVVSTNDAGLVGATDFDVLNYALANNLVIITRDADFLRLTSEGQEHAGIAFWSSKHKSIGELVTSLVLLWRTTTSEEMHNLIKYY